MLTLVRPGVVFNDKKYFLGWAQWLMPATPALRDFKPKGKTFDKLNIRL